VKIAHTPGVTVLNKHGKSMIITHCIDVGNGQQQKHWVTNAMSQKWV